MYNEPMLAQPAKRLTRQSLGMGIVIIGLFLFERYIIRTGYFVTVPETIKKLRGSLNETEITD
jgi:hypothetical protein